MTTKDLIREIQQEIEWFSTTEGDEVECISIENLEYVLTKFTNTRILLSEDHAPQKRDMINFPHKQLNIFVND
jgi:hypothetical protein